MDWIQIGQGWYDFAKGEFENVTVQDIAHSLSQINRFTGNAYGNYSVAAHSIIGAEYLETEGKDPLAALYFLTHDAHECAMSDIPRPVMNSLVPSAQHDLRVMKGQIDKRIHFLLNIPWPPIPSIRDMVKQMDDVMLATEKRDIMPPCSRQWSLPYAPLKDRNIYLSNSENDENLWLGHYRHLMARNELQLPENMA